MMRLVLRTRPVAELKSIIFAVETGTIENDRFGPASGHAFFRGGEGFDTVRMPGRSNEYTIGCDGRKYLLASDAGIYTFLESIERIEFEQGGACPAFTLPTLGVEGL